MRRRCNQAMDSSTSFVNNVVVNFPVTVKYGTIETHITITSTTPVSDFEMLIRDKIPELDHETFDLSLRFTDGNQTSNVALANAKSKSLEDMNIVLNSEYTYTLTVMETKKSQMALDVDAGDDDLLLGASASPTTGEVPMSDSNDCDSIEQKYPVYDYPSTVCMAVGPAGDVLPSSSSIEITNYVGLVNQAMTCYLNSLVQALFMTPEFRNAIYNWEFDGKNETKSIPYQLQKLFLNLQTSTRTAVETTDLTTSFGWQGSEAWHQHDIQELCRVMFDALERKFEKTKQANLINDLYEGKMLDYVKCLECGTEKSREDTFLDIPLPVRPFGSIVAYNSVEEALREFVQPETLEGNNQYHCEKCNKKCDAHKGLKFIKFPYLLTLHLKRFDFDYNTMHRIKLNDKVVFPETLNLNSFVPNRTESDGLVDETIVRCDECSTTDSGSALDDESCHGTDLSSVANEPDENCEDSDEGIDVSSGNNIHHEPEAKGPYFYELFSIMIHSGSASGGHYYAYIKDFDKNHWLCFNDQSVNRITEDDIKKTYGGGPQKGYYSGVYTSSTNAYMLMYRQIDQERNTLAMKLDDFPPHLNALLERMRIKEKEDRLNKERQNNSLRFNVYCVNPSTEETTDIRINMCRDATLSDAIHMAHRRFKLEGFVDVEDCRLVVYNSKQACVDYSFESDELKLCDILDKFRIFYSMDLLLEVRPPGGTFRRYIAGGVDMKVYYVNVETEEVTEPVTMHVAENQTVHKLKEDLGKMLPIDVDIIKVVYTKACNILHYLDNDLMVVPIDGISTEFKLFVSNILDDDPDKKFENSKFKSIVERFQYIVYLGVLLPDTDFETLEKLFIPSLDSGETLVPDQSSSPGLRVSPQPGPADSFGDQSNSEDNSLSDSDRTLVGDTPGDCHIFSSSSTSPADQHMISPMDPTEDVYNYEVLGNPSEEMSWENGSPNMIKNYFKVVRVRDCKSPDGYTRLCKLFVDNRTSLETFKKYLEPVLKVPKEYFKVYRHYSSPDEEWSNLSELLRMNRDGQILSVKLGRALAKNEYSCKVFLLKPGSTDTNYFLFEHILSKGQSVGVVKKEILSKMKKQHLLELSPNNCRLREKCIRKPKKVYLDDQIFGSDISLLSNFEMYLQELDRTDLVTSINQLVLFGRRWSPSTLTLHPFEEFVLETKKVDELKQKVVDLTQIPFDNVQVTFLRNSFPADMNVLDVHSDLDWEHNYSALNQWPLNAEDGTVFFYRDSREELKELTAEEKKEINIKENTRLGRGPSKIYTSSERSLKIYLDTWPSESEDNCID